MKNLLRLPILGLLLASGSALAAEENGWAIGTGALHTDNAQRLSTGGTSDTVLLATASVVAAHDGARVDASIRGQGEYLHYTDGTYDDDLIGSLQAALQLGLIQDRLTWSFADNFGQVTRDPFAAVTPENRQNVNSFSTGPDAVLRFGAANSLRVTGRWSSATYEESSSTDSTRLSGGLAFVRNLSDSANLQVAANAYRVTFDVAGDPGYDVQEYFGRYESKWPRQTLEADVGLTQLHDDGRSDSQPLVRVTWNRKISSFVTLETQLGTEFRNAADQFEADLPSSGGSTGDVLLTDNAFQSTYGSIGLALDRPRTRFGVRLGYGEEEYAANTNEPDRQYWSLDASVTRRVTERLDAVLSARFDQREADATAGNDDTSSFALQFNWQAGRKLYFSLGARTTSRNSDVASLDYDETMAFLSVGLRTGSAPLASIGY